MNVLSADPFPSDSLVDWAAANLATLRLPRDRPWLHSEQAPGETPSGFVLCCRCGQNVRCWRWKCVGECCIWIGQCPICEAVIWTYQSLEAGNV